MRRYALLVLMIVVLIAFFGTGCSQGASEDSTDDEGAEASAEETATSEMAAEPQLTSAAFEPGGVIPAKYCNTGVEGGENVSIPLEWAGMPDETKSLALIMVDHHEVAQQWVHWMAIDMPPTTMSLAEGASGAAMPAGAQELLSTQGEVGYQGPEPPAGTGDHEYETMLFALDVEAVEIAEDATYEEFLSAVDAHTLAQASVSGFFGR